MKQSFLAVLLLVFMNACSPSKPESKNDYTSFTIHRGTNIAHWLSQSERRVKSVRNFLHRKT